MVSSLVLAAGLAVLAAVTTAEQPEMDAATCASLTGVYVLPLGA